MILFFFSGDTLWQYCISRAQKRLLYPNYVNIHFMRAVKEELMALYWNVIVMDQPQIDYYHFISYD